MARASGKVYKISDCLGYAWSIDLRRREDDEFEGEKWPETEIAFWESEAKRKSQGSAAVRGQLNGRADGKDRGKVRAKWLDKVRGI